MRDNPPVFLAPCSNTPSRALVSAHLSVCAVWSRDARPNRQFMAHQSSFLILTNVRTMVPTAQNHAMRWAVEPLNHGLVRSHRHFRWDQGD